MSPAEEIKSLTPGPSGSTIGSCVDAFSLHGNLILKEDEIRNLRLIMKAVFDNTPVEQIKNYLVLAS